MSNLNRFPRSKTSCPLKPWLMDFIFNYDRGQSVTANAVKIIENISEDKNGNMLKLVTDGNVHIKAKITHQSIKACMQENDDDMPPWDKALILMRKYSLLFQPKTELENCEFILIVDEFKLWDLQTGFDFKKTLHPCSNTAKVKMKLRDKWQIWKETVVPVSEEPSSIGDSMGSQLLSLLAEMGQETQPEDSQPDKSVVDNDSASTSEAKSDFPPVINGPTLISDNCSVPDSQKEPFLQYIDSKDHFYVLQKTPESQSQQYEEYEFSSPSEVSLEFSCESSDDSSTENKMAPKSSRNDTTNQISQERNTAQDSNITAVDKLDGEAKGNDESPGTEKGENCKPSDNNNEQVLCESTNGPNLSESDETLVKSKSECKDGQSNSKDFMQSYVKYLNTCSTTVNHFNTEQNNTGLSKADESVTNASNDNDHEKSSLIQTHQEIDDHSCLAIQDNDNKSIQDLSESEVYTNLVENDYDSIQWWSSAEDNSCLSDIEQDRLQESEKIYGDDIMIKSDKNQKHKKSKCDKNSKHNKTPKRRKRVKRNETTVENSESDSEKISDCTTKLEHKSTPERYKMQECEKTSESDSSDTLTEVDNVFGTQPFFVNSSEEILESIGDTTCVGLKYKENVSEMQKDDNEIELSGMQPLVSQPERNSDSVSTREPYYDEIFNSNSNNSCEIIHKSDSSCYEISEFDSKNSSDSTKNILHPVKSDAPKSGNLSIIYQSTQKTVSKREVPLFPVSPITNTEQPSTSKNKNKESVESLVFDTEYEEELRLREMAKTDPKTDIKPNKKSTSKSVNNTLTKTGMVLDELGSKDSVIQNENIERSDKSDQEKLSKTSVFNSDKASNSDLLLIQAAKSAEKRFPQKIPEELTNSSNSLSPKPVNTQEEISVKDTETVLPLQEKNHVENSVADLIPSSSESVIIIGSSESTNSEESRYSQNVISFCTSPRKKHPCAAAKQKTKMKVLAADTESNIIAESPDIPTSDVNNSVLNLSTMYKTDTNSPPQSNDHSIINLSDLSDTSSEEREEPHPQTNQRLKDVFHERLRKRKRKLSMGKTSSVEISESNPKRKRCSPEQQVVNVDVHVSQNQSKSEQKSTCLVSENRRLRNLSLTSTCDKGISIETSKHLSQSAIKLSATRNKNLSLKNIHQSVQADHCKHILQNNNDIPKSSSSGSFQEIDHHMSSNSKCYIDQLRSSSSKSIKEIDQPRPSSSKSNLEIDQPRSSSSRYIKEIDQPRPSSSKSNLEIDQPRSSSSRYEEIDRPRPSSSKYILEIDQPRSSSSRYIKEIDQPRSSSSRYIKEIYQPRSSSSRYIKEIDQPRSSRSKSNMDDDQRRSSKNRSIIEIDQPRSSTSRSNMENDQPRSSSNRNKDMSDDRNWWEESDQPVNKPSTSIGVRNDSRLPECDTRNIPQYFEDLFEDETPSELQQKLLNFKISSDKFDCIYKYIHKK